MGAVALTFVATGDRWLSDSDSTYQTKLDLGCGSAKAPGAIGADIHPFPGVDVLCDLDHFPYPFKDSSFSSVFMHHCLEHLEDVVGVLEEVHRIAKDGATVHIEVPHFSSYGAYSDPTHKQYFSFFTFDHFVEGTRVPHYSPICYRIVSRRICLAAPYRFFGLGLWASLFPGIYERNFTFIFPARAVRVVLRVVK